MPNTICDSIYASKGMVSWLFVAGRTGKRRTIPFFMLFSYISVIGFDYTLITSWDSVARNLHFMRCPDPASHSTPLSSTDKDVHKNVGMAI